MSALSQFFLGTPAKMMQQDVLTGGQSQLLNQLLGGLGGPLQSGFQNLSQLLSGSPQAMQAFERPAITQFEQQIVPGIAERFAGSGSLSSSQFNRALAGAGANLAENLQAQRAGLQQNALSQLMQLLSTGLGTQQFENIYTPRQPGFLESLTGPALQATGTALGGFFGRR